MLEIRGLHKIYGKYHALGGLDMTVKDGALYGFYSSDSWVGALQKTMVKVIEAETGVPHFYIEGDLWALGGEARETRLAIVRSICNYLKISNI